MGLEGLASAGCLISGCSCFCFHPKACEDASCAHKHGVVEVGNEKAEEEADSPSKE